MIKAVTLIDSCVDHIKTPRDCLHTLGKYRVSDLRAHEDTVHDDNWSEKLCHCEDIQHAVSEAIDLAAALLSLTRLWVHTLRSDEVLSRLHSVSTRQCRSILLDKEIN